MQRYEKATQLHSLKFSPAILPQSPKDAQTTWWRVITEDGINLLPSFSSETPRRRQRRGHLLWLDFNPQQDHDTCSIASGVSQTNNKLGMQAGQLWVQGESLRPYPKSHTDAGYLLRSVAIRSLSETTSIRDHAPRYLTRVEPFY